MGRTKLSVVLIIVCAVKCLAMTYDELEDFAEHLKKTSQLSPTLKKGAESDVDYDDDEVVSDHAWEDSGKFEGDLILNERQRRLIVEDVAEGLARNGISDGAKRWPNNEVIVYIQVEHFTSDQVQAIESGIDDLARASCVKFRRYKKGDRDAVVIQGNRRGCFSQVGYQGGYQVLNLSGRHPVGRGCFRHGTVVHELLHTLGFYHMQSSPDRDDYVNIVWANIVQQSEAKSEHFCSREINRPTVFASESIFCLFEAARHNFRKYNSFSVSDFGVGYDYDSVLHYSRRAFSSNGQDTIVPKQGGAEIGQRIGLSDKDTQKLNKMYCDADWDNGQADESPPKKTETKKKNGKNKPFEGQGIGYHQGKAVAIKILPAPETFMLPDVPSFHVFDYFSKEPQILSPSENQGFRIGKKIAYSPPKATQHRQTTPESHSPVHIDTVSKFMTNHNHNEENLQGRNVAEVKQTEKHVFHQAAPELSVDISTHDVHSSPPDEKVVDADLMDAFDRLSKIIKMHVYPSQTPDLSIYKMNGHYNNHYDPPQIKAVSDIKIVSPVPNEANKQEEDKMHSIRFINNMYEAKYEAKTKNPLKDKSKKTVPDRESNPPWYKHYEEEFVSVPDFKPLEHYRENNDYTSIHSPKIYMDEKPNENDDDWYQKHIDPYLDRVYHDYSEESSEGHEHDGDEKESSYSSIIPKRTQDYSAFRFPAKVTKKWYNDDSHVYR